MPEFVWFFYGIGILMTWFENRWIVGAWPTDRPIWFSPANQAKFWILRLVICYGIIAGLWFYDGWVTALIAFIAYYVFQKITFRIYFSREIMATAERYANLDREEAKSRNEQVGESAIMQRALEAAKLTVVRNMKGGEF